jgi:hypothetical protein
MDWAKRRLGLAFKARNYPRIILWALLLIFLTITWGLLSDRAHSWANRQIDDKGLQAVNFFVQFVGSGTFILVAYIILAILWIVISYFFIKQVVARQVQIQSAIPATPTLSRRATDIGVSKAGRFTMDVPNGQSKSEIRVRRMWWEGSPLAPLGLDAIFGGPALRRLFLEIYISAPIEVEMTDVRLGIAEVKDGDSYLCSAEDFNSEKMKGYFFRVFGFLLPSVLRHTHFEYQLIMNLDGKEWRSESFVHNQSRQ